MLIINLLGLIDYEAKEVVCTSSVIGSMRPRGLSQDEMKMKADIKLRLSTVICSGPHRRNYSHERCLSMDELRIKVISWQIL